MFKFRTPHTKALLLYQNQTDYSNDRLITNIKPYNSIIIKMANNETPLRTSQNFLLDSDAL